MPDETDLAVGACNDYLRMKAPSLSKLARHYGKKEAKGDGVPTVHLRTLEEWSRLYGWKRRLSAKRAQADAEKEARSRYVMRTGYAQEWKRVEALNTLVKDLLKELAHSDTLGEPALWLKRYKQIGSGLFAEKIEERHFNGSIIKAIRGIMDDLALETGGRQKNINVTMTGLAGSFAAAESFEDPSTFYVPEYEILE